MRALLSIITLAILCSDSKLLAAEFIDNFRIEDYLAKAVELQNLEPEQREARMREMANDHDQAVPVIPLCRMLFEAKPDTEFRSPRLGAPSMIRLNNTDGVILLEPIALYEGIPILTTWGYTLAGKAEPSSKYLEYCLKECRWRETKFKQLEKDQIGKIVEKFIELQMSSKEDSERLRRQTK